MVKISQLIKSHRDGRAQHCVLGRVSFGIDRGESVAITGESGSGKSTLLHLIAALDKPDAGSIEVDGEDITRFTEAQADLYRRRRIGIIFQRFNLIDCLSIADNIALPARISGQYDRDYLAGLTAQLGLEDLIHRLPTDLSGGEQQRVAIARALAHRPSLVLADEPTGNLDDKNSDKVANLLMNTCTSLGTSLMLVTHSKSLAELTGKHYALHKGELKRVAPDS